MAHTVLKFSTKLAKCGTYVANFSTSAAKSGTKIVNFGAAVVKFGRVPKGFQVNSVRPGWPKQPKTIGGLAFSVTGLRGSVQSASLTAFSLALGYGLRV